MFTERKNKMGIDGQLEEENSFSASYKYFEVLLIWKHVHK